MSNDSSTRREGISRREMVQKLVSGASSGIIASSIGAPVQAETRPAVAAVENPQSAQPVEGATLFLDSHQAETLRALAEIIIPGSAKADVTQFIDLLLSVDTLENRTNFVASISAMDGEALRDDGTAFTKVTPARQLEIVTRASESASGGLRDHFDNLKEWVRKAYYSSETGMRELGWSDNYFYDSLPPVDGPTS